MSLEPGFHRVQIYVARNGKAPFTQWMHSLRDKQTKARILTCIDRVRLGNLGDCERVGAGVYEGASTPDRAIVSILASMAPRLFCCCAVATSPAKRVILRWPSRIGESSTNHDERE